MADQNIPAHSRWRHNEETVGDYIWRNEFGLGQIDLIARALAKMNPLYADHGTQPPRQDITEWRGRNGDVYKISFFHPEHPDMGELPTMQQVVTSVLTGAFSRAGFTVEVNQMGTVVSVRNTSEAIEKWIQMSAEIHKEFKASDIQNFTPEFF